MKIYYRINGTDAEILRCFGNDGTVVLPKKIEEFTVRKIAPYTFSDKKSGEDTDFFIYETEDSFFTKGEVPLLAGEHVEQIILPDSVEAIGNYAFYGCKKLNRLRFSDDLKGIGSGAFTGCGSLRFLDIHMKVGGQSCAKEILGELWQRMDITFCYEKELSKLVFPEHYEEAVENTPARILFTQHHGSGNNYRQCFYNKEMDYAKYDGLFSVAAAWDRPEVLADLALSRLEFPYQLSKKSEEAYTGLLKARYAEILTYLIGEEKFRQLQVFAAAKLWTQDMLEYALKVAADRGKTEISAYLMNEKQKLFPTRKKTFLL